MNKEQAQAFVNSVERELMAYVQESDTEKLDELDEALIEFDNCMMRIMEIILEE